MKIFARVDRYVPQVMAGSEITLHHHLKALVQRGHEVIVCCKGAIDADIDGVEVHHPDGPTELELTYDWCDVVVTQGGFARQTIAEAQGRRPIVYFAHTTQQVQAQQIRHGEVALIVYNSVSLAETGPPVAPSVVAYPPVSPSDYLSADGDRNMVTLINLSDKKGGPMFWWLARKMKDVKFLGVTGGYGPQVIGDAPNAEVLPTADDITTVYRRTSVLIMPSTVETYGRTALEAGANGIPLVLARTPGLLEAVGEANALWADPKKPDQWEGHLRYLLSDPRVYMDYSSRARARAEKMWDITRAQELCLENALIQVASPERSRVWAVASEVHYGDHAAAYLACVRPDKRGPILLPREEGADKQRATARQLWGAGAVVYLVPDYQNKFQETDFLTAIGRPDFRGSSAIVTSNRDKAWASQYFSGRIIRGEHGAGLSYSDLSHASFAGGAGHNGCLGAMAPNEACARTIAEAHPTMSVAAVGCPRVEILRRAVKTKSLQVGILRKAGHHPGKRPTIALSFRYVIHTENLRCQELESAWPFYNGKIDLPDWNVILHAHPRSWSRFPSMLTEAKRLGWRVENSWEAVLDTADIFAVDNSSVALEWLHIRGRGLILLDTPRYRRWVTHPNNPRFWALSREHGVPAVADPSQLGAIATAELTTTGAAYDHYSPTEPGRLNAWLTQPLRDSKDSTCVFVRQSCVGEYGRLVAGERTWLPTIIANTLAARGCVAVQPARAQPEFDAGAVGRSEFSDLSARLIYEGATIWRPTL